MAISVKRCEMGNQSIEAAGPAPYQVGVNSNANPIQKYGIPCPEWQQN